MTSRIFFINLSGGEFESLEKAQEAGAATINYGVFISTTLYFLIIAFAIFLLVKQVNRLKKQPDPAPAEPTTKSCPFCVSEIAIKATRCPQCTAELKAA